MNVGFSSNGKTFLGSDAQSACHFSLAVFDPANYVMTYGDSLGGPVPENLKDTVNEYVGALFENERREITVNECYSSTSTFNGLHRCQELCNAFYSLQNDGDLCGVISIIMAIIVCLSQILLSMYLQPHMEAKRTFLTYIFQNHQNMENIYGQF